MLALLKPRVMIGILPKRVKKMTALFNKKTVGWAVGGLIVILLCVNLVNNWVGNQQVGLECSDDDYTYHYVITYPSSVDEDGRIKNLDYINCSDASYIHDNPVFTEDRIYFFEGGGWIDRKTLKMKMGGQCKTIEVGQAIGRARAEGWARYGCVEEENRI